MSETNPRYGEPFGEIAGTPVFMHPPGTYRAPRIVNVDEIRDRWTGLSDELLGRALLWQAAKDIQDLLDAVDALRGDTVNLPR